MASNKLKNDKDKEYVIGSLRITPSRYKVSVEGRDLTLTLKEFEMLLLKS